VQILPRLVAATWSEHSDGFSRRVDVGVPSRHTPWIAHTFDPPDASGTFPELLDSMLIEAGWSFDMAQTQALGNLRQRPLAWKPFGVTLGPSRAAATLLVCSDAFAAERLLDGEALCEAQRILGTPALCVAAPRRGRILAITAALPEEALFDFVSAVEEEFQGAPMSPITPLTFLVRDGKILGITDPDERSTVAGQT
jgi:uncharacterized protein YtpQ (UPF0354 family)